ncbi:MAG: transcription antitermination factor NusB [Chloroflexota bacterium]
MTNRRRLARHIAFQTLFELELRPERQAGQSLADRTVQAQEEFGEDLDERSIHFAIELVKGTRARRKVIDKVLCETAPAFPIAQMAATDRVALEVGVYELMFAHDAPVSVIINEAVELAKTYGSENSGRFVNGVLGTIAEGLAGQIPVNSRAEAN